MASVFPDSRLDPALYDSTYQSPGSSRIVKTRITRVLDGDTFKVSDPSIKGSIRLSGVDAPEISHPYNFGYRKDRKDMGNIMSRINTLRSQPYSAEATDFANSLVGNQEVTLIITGKDDKGRDIARVVTSDGRDLSQELIKRGLAKGFFPGDSFHDPTVMTKEIEAIAINNIVNGVGLYSNKNYVHPVKFRDGILEWPGTSRREDMRKWADYSANHLAQKYGVDNKQLSPLFDSTGELGGLSIPSRMGSSFFYAVALHNNMMRQAGLYDETLSSGDFGVLSSLYRIAVLKSPNMVMAQIPDSVQSFDRELSSPGLGSIVNEHIFMPGGYGRLYKDEVGLIPSIAGAIGSILDKTYLYYTDNRSDQQRMSEDLSSGVGYKDSKKGFFESTLTFGTNLILSSASAISLYLVVGEPLNLLLSEGFKTQTEDFISLALSDKDGTERHLNRFSRWVAKSGVLGVETLEGSVTPSDIKIALAKRVNELGNTDFYSTGFSLTPYHITSIFRQRAANLLDMVVRPSLIDMINPFPLDSKETKEFISSVDELIFTIGRGVGLNIDYGSYKNYDEMMAAASKGESLEDVKVLITNAGIDRQTNVAKALQGVLDRVPLNPLNWRVFSGQVKAGTEIVMLGSLFSFDEATTYMKNLIWGQGGLTKALAVHGVVDARADIKPTYIGEASNRIHSGMRMIGISLKEGLLNNLRHIKLAQELNDATSLFLLSEKSLMEGNKIKWNSAGDARVITGSSMNGPTIFDALADYEKYITKGGPSTEIVAGVAERLSKAQISQLTSSTAAQLLKPGLGSDPTLSRSRAKFALYTVMALDMMLIGNEIFQSTSGVSLITQLRAALHTGKLGLAPEFTGNRIIPTNGNPILNYGLPIATAVSLLAGASFLSTGLQKAVYTYYELTDDAVQSLIEDEGLKVFSDNEMRKLLGKDLLPKEAGGIKHLVRLGEDGKIVKSVTLFEKIVDGGSTHYRSAAVARMVGDKGLNTAILFGMGVLAMGGIRNSVATVLETTRSFSAATSDITGPAKGSLDPLLFAIAGGAIGGVIGGKAGIGTIIPGALGFLSGGLLGSITNALGIRITDVGVGTNRVNPLNSNAVSGLSGFKALIERRIRSGEKVSSLEMMAAFYSGEMSKVLPALDQDRLGPTVQVIARQAPLPFIQFFLTETIKGKPTMSNGLPDADANGTVYYGVGIQSAPMFGLSINIQAPIKISRSNSGMPFGIANNEQSNVMDIINAAAYISSTSALTLGTASLFLRTVNRIFGPDGFMMKGVNMSHISSAVDLLDGGQSFTQRLVRVIEAVPASGIRTLRGMFMSDIDLYVRTAKDVYDVHGKPSKPMVSRSRFVKAIAGGVLGYVGLGLFSQAISGGDPVVSIFGQAAGFTAGALINAVALPWFQEIGRNPPPRVVAQAGSTMTAFFNKASSTITDKMVGKPLMSVSNLLIRRPLSMLKGPALSIGIASTAAYFMTDPNFGVSKGMDRYDQSGGPDWSYRLAVIGTYTVLMSTIAYKIGRVGLTPSATFESLANILQKKRDLNNIISDPKNGTISRMGASLERFWLNMWERSLNRDAAYIVEASATINDPILKTEDEIKKLDDYRNFALNRVKSKAMKLSGGELIFETGTEESMDILLGKGTPDNPGFLRTMAEESKNVRTLKGRVMPLLTSRRAIRTLAPVVLGTSIVGALLTGGGDHTSGIDWLLDNLQAGFGFKALQYPGNVLADVFRLVTGMDRSIPNEGPLPIPLSPGESFGQSPYKVKYQKLIKANSDKGISKVWKDISRMMVLDEPNAFIGFFNMFGFTFRPNEYGGRQSFYIQLQSAGQDISTAVYSMSASFLFKEALAGGSSLQLNIISALKDISSLSKSEGGLTKLTQKDTRRAAMNLLGVTASLQPLTSRRKVSKADGGLTDFIASDELVASAVDARNRATANMTFQPGMSLISRMLSDAFTKQDGFNLLSKYILNKDPSALYELFNDTFNNTTRELQILGVKFFDFNKKAQNLRASSVVFDDASQWTNMYSVFNQQERPGTDVMEALNFGTSLLNPILPGPLKNIVLIGSGLVAGSVALSFFTTLGLRQEHNELQKATDDYFGRTWYTDKGIRGAPDQARSFTVRRMRGTSGVPLADGDQSRLVFHKGSRYMLINSSLMKAGGQGDALVRSLNESMAVLEKAIENSYMGNLYGDTEKFSFLDNMRRTVNDKLTELGTVTYQVGGERAAYVSEMKRIYKAETDKLVDNYFKALESVEVEVPGRGKIKLIAFLHPDIDLNTNTINTLADLEATYKPFENVRENVRKEVSRTIDEIVENEVRGRSSGRIHSNLIHSMRGDVHNSVRHLTEKVLHKLTTSKQLQVMRHNLGGLAAFPSMDFVFNIEKQFNNLSRRSYSPTSPSRSIPLETSETKLSTSTRTVVSGMADEVTDIRSYTRPTIKGQSGIGKGIWSAFQHLGFAMDIFQSFDIFSAFSRLAGAQVNDGVSDGERILLRNEAGSTTLNVGLGFAATYAATAIGPKLWSLIAGGLGIAAGSGPPGWLVAAGIATVVVGGIAIAATWKNFGGPLLERVMKSKAMKKTTDAISKAYYFVGDGIGYIFGDAIPSIGSFIGGDRGKAAITSSIGGVLGGASLGLAAALFAGAGVITGGTIGLIALAGGAIAGIMGLLFPKAVADFSYSVSKAVSGWTIGNVPIGSILASEPGKIYGRDIYGFSHPGSPFTMGTAQQAIDQEFASQKQAAGDASGKATAAQFTNPSLYGQSSYDSSYSEHWSRSSSSIRPANVMSDALINREVQIRAQYYNQSIVGRYMWRTMAKSAANYNQIDAYQKSSEINVALQAVEMLKKTGNIKIRSLIVDKINIAQLEQAGVLQALSEVNALVETINTKKTQQVVATVKKDNITSKKTDATNLNSLIQTGKKPIIKKEITNSTDGSTTIIKKDKAADNEMLSAATQYLTNKVDINIYNMMPA